MRPRGRGRGAAGRLRLGGVVGPDRRRLRRRCGRGGSRARTRAARPRRPRPRPAARTARWRVACMAAPPRSCRLTRIPVNPSTASGPDTKAKASGVMTVTSARPRSRAGPEMAAPGHRGQHRHRARAGGDGGGGLAPIRAGRRCPRRPRIPTTTAPSTRGRRSCSATRAASAMVSPSARVSAPRWWPETERTSTTLRPPTASTPARTGARDVGAQRERGTAGRGRRQRMPGTGEPGTAVATEGHVRRTTSEPCDGGPGTLCHDLSEAGPEVPCDEGRDRVRCRASRDDEG